MNFQRLLALLLVWVSGAVYANAPVTSEVTFNQVTRLYTYTYVLDTDALPEGGFRELAIRSNYIASFYAPWPASHSEPEGWNFALAVGGWTQDGVPVYGSFWTWGSRTYDVDPGGLLTYSFSTRIAPDTGTDINFFVYSGVNAGPENLPVAFGRVVGPDLNHAFATPTYVPEPATMLLWVIGLIGLIASGWTRVNARRAAAAFTPFARPIP
ncbi:hypothetical protein [Mitsuaria sp. 7]|uniref:hypothetical protein n=1 Tax=Mitsuaria sp. 7 TaxID=1658665 RepID=UPI0018D4BFD1|nr:hypothetical protein [Mitsuaria sp. 7]